MKPVTKIIAIVVAVLIVLDRCHSLPHQRQQLSPSDRIEPQFGARAAGKSRQSEP